MRVRKAAKRVLARGHIRAAPGKNGLQELHRQHPGLPHPAPHPTSPPTATRSRLKTGNPSSCNAPSRPHPPACTSTSWPLHRRRGRWGVGYSSRSSSTLATDAVPLNPTRRVGLPGPPQPSSACRRAQQGRAGQGQAAVCLTGLRRRTCSGCRYAAVRCGMPGSAYCPQQQPVRVHESLQ